MRQILCDLCGDPISQHVPPGDGELVKVGIRLGWGVPVEDTYWHEYHRGCARSMTVEQVYKRTGLLPL